jgi:hypothetical protein
MKQVWSSENGVEDEMPMVPNYLEASCRIEIIQAGPATALPGAIHADLSNDDYCRVIVYIILLMVFHQ